MLNFLITLILLFAIGIPIAIFVGVIAILYLGAVIDEFHKPKEAKKCI